MKNVQRRVIPAPPERLGQVIDEITDPGRSVWPRPAWPDLRLDNGPTPGSSGGHSTIRYTVTAYEPGRRLAFAFNQETGLDGWHELKVTTGENGRPTLVHTIEARTTGPMRWRWPLAIRWLHEALVQDLLDNAELAATGTLAHGPARWSPWVRLLRWWLRPTR